jgi:hypothetical protein
MKAILNNPIVAQYFVTLEQLLNAGTTHAKAVKALIPVFNKASKEDQDIIRNKVAEIIGSKYGVKPKVMEKGINKGLLGFNAHGTQAESNARDFMRDNFSVSKPVVGKKPTTKTTRKSVDKVEQLLTQFYAMSKRDQARFDSLRAKDAK